MVPIPYARSYYATARGRFPKLVQCEECGFEYVYFLTATAGGEGTSLFFLDNQGAKERAHRSAEAKLADRLLSSVGVVPGPRCGQIQTHMLAEARRMHLSWMRAAWIPLLLVGMLLAMATGILRAEMVVSDTVLNALWAVVALLVGLALG